MHFEYLWPHPQEMKVSDDFAAPTEISVLGPASSEQLSQDIAGQGLKVASGASGYVVQSGIDPEAAPQQGYCLTLDAKGGQLTGADPAGLANGVQTLVQILALGRRSTSWSALVIKDWPAYPTRALMVDMGRSTFPLVYLKRIVRILARLKMNQLHLHLFDDQLCGIRFDGLPFGSKNPYAITIAELAELVEYAGGYHVEIMPELEGWAHMESLGHHMPELRGGSGMYNNGSSFLVGEKMFDLMRELTRQIVDVLPEQGIVHYGLDEAQWFLDPAMPKDFSPVDLVQRLYDILQETAAKAGKSMTMQVWADHGGRPIPEGIQENVIIEPWAYWRRTTDHIMECIKNYSANPRLRWAAGAGQSVAHGRGAYFATGLWCRKALGRENFVGPDITLWGWNDLEHKLMSLFAGAYYAWNPQAPTEWGTMDDDETFDKLVCPIMYWWQNRFGDGHPEQMIEDRGPRVLMGNYLWGPKHGQPVSPTASVPGNTWWGWMGDECED